MKAWIAKLLASMGLRPVVTPEPGQSLVLEVDFLPESRIVRVRARGVLDQAGNDRLVAVAVAAVNQHGAHRVLVDDRALTIAMNYAQVYDLPKHNRELGVGQYLRVAMLYTDKGDNRRVFEFYENRLSLNDFEHAVFTDEAEAIAWLTRPELG